MKQISLTPKEFYLFKKLANFYYTFAISAGMVYVEANSKLLENLGY